MTTKELIELLKQFPSDTEVQFGKYNGCFGLLVDDMYINTEVTPIEIIIPDYECFPPGIPLIEYLAENNV